MNAAEKAKVLKANGYERTKTTNGDTVWWFDGMAIAEHESNAESTQIAYVHWSKSLSFDEKMKLHKEQGINYFPSLSHHEAQTETTEQAANDAAGESDYAEVVAEAEPTGYMRPCDDCGGSGTEPHPYFDGVRHCSSCDGTGIHQSEVIAIASDHAAMNALELEQSCTELQAENHALNLENQSLKIQLTELTAQLEKAQGDLSAAQRIIIGAGKTHHALESLIENAITNANLSPLAALSKLMELKRGYEASNPAPVASEAAEVTLTSEQINTLSSMRMTDGSFATWTITKNMNELILSHVLKRDRREGNFHIFQLAQKFDTPATRAAIANRRKELGL